MVQVEVIAILQNESCTEVSNKINEALKRLSGVMLELRDIKYIPDVNGIFRMMVVIEYYANGGA